MKPRSKQDADAIWRKLALVSGLYEAALEIKKHRLRCTHPELSEDEIKRRALALVATGCA